MKSYGHFRWNFVDIIWKSSFVKFEECYVAWRECIDSLRYSTYHCASFELSISSIPYIWNFDLILHKMVKMQDWNVDLESRFNVFAYKVEPSVNTVYPEVHTCSDKNWQSYAICGEKDWNEKWRFGAVQWWYHLFWVCKWMYIVVTFDKESRKVGEKSQFIVVEKLWTFFQLFSTFFYKWLEFCMKTGKWQ